MTRSSLWRMVGVGALCAVVSGSLVAGLTRQDSPRLVAGQDEGEVIARLNENVVLRSDRLRRQLAALPPDLRSALQADRTLLEQWVRERLVEAQLFEEAAQQGWPERESLAATLRAVTEQLVVRDYLANFGAAPEGYPSDAELARAYQSASQQLIAPERFHLQQIFVAETAARDAQSRVNDLLAQARQTTDFAALAEAESDNPAIDTGWVTLAQLLPEVREQVQGMTPGAIAGPVRSEAGWHLLRLVAREPSRQLALEEVSDLLRERLREQYRQQRINEHVNAIIERSSLSINGALLSRMMETLD